MMRPYLAILADSFHAALASRVLWCAMVAIWLLLAALAPIGYREDFTTTFRWQDFAAGTKLKAMLATGLTEPDEAGPAVAAVAAAMPDELKQQLRRVGQGGEERIELRLFADAFNELLDDESWYDASAWSDKLRPFELTKLEQADAAELGDSARRRRARLRLEAAFPGVFEASSAQSILLTYAGFDFPASFAVDGRQFKALINQFVLPQLVNLLLGFVLVFLGILVTASLIPDLLQPGSLHLLLSKPVSRTLLLLSKFLGGCAFVFLCVTQLVIGLWLISGFRLDIWNARLLWCIPVSVFLFSVFYSVSVLAGLRWRSAILSIGVTCMFGAVVFVVGFVGGLFDNLVRGPDTIVSTALSGDQIFAKTRGQGLKRFDPSTNQWSEILEGEAMGRDRVIAPVGVDDPTGRPGEFPMIATAQIRGGRFNAFGSGSLDLLLIEKRNDWEPRRGIRLPVSTGRLYATPDGGLIAQNTGGLFYAPASEVGSDVDQASEADGLGSFLSKLMNMQGAGTDKFKSILPSRISVVRPSRVVLRPGGERASVTSSPLELWLLSVGRLFHLRQLTTAAEDSGKPAEGPWDVIASVTIDGEASADAELAVSGGLVIVSRLGEPVQLFNADDLSSIRIDEANLAETEAFAESDWVSLLGLPSVDGRSRFLNVASDGTAEIIRMTTGEKTTTSTSQPMNYRDVESVHYDTASGHVLLAHG